jgi:peroxiredoxin Q/BCP
MISTKTATLAKDFFANDTHGRLIWLSDYRGKKHVVLVFYRGVGFPYCQEYTAQLRQDYQEFIDRDAEVIVVGTEKAKSFSDYWGSEKIPFIGIPDPAHTIAKLFRPEINTQEIDCIPALIVIDKDGKIRYTHYGTSMSEIPSNEDILSLLDDLNKESA